MLKGCTFTEYVESGCLLHQYSCARLITLRYIRGNVAILMAATAWLMSFSLYRVRIWFVYRTFKVFPEKNGDTWKVRYTNQIRTRCRTVGHHQPRSCSLQNRYVTSDIPQHGDSTTVEWLFKHSKQYTYQRQREYHRDTCKTEGGLLLCGPTV